MVQGGRIRVSVKGQLIPVGQAGVGRVAGEIIGHINGIGADADDQHFVSAPVQKLQIFWQKIRGRHL